MSTSPHPPRRSAARRPSGLVVVGLALSFPLLGCGDGGREGGDRLGPPSLPPEAEALGVAGAHEHGVLALDVATDGPRISIALRAPEASLFGFEGEPSTDDERAARVAALETLRTRFDELVITAPALGCRVDEVRIVDGEEEGHEAEGADHEGEEEGHDHEEEEGHDHEDGDHEHADVLADVSLSCDGPVVGSQVTLAFGELFPDVAYVDLQVVTDGGQAGGRVPAGSTFRL